jgi:TetR/AcrR family transcriptional regulator
LYSKFESLPEEKRQRILNAAIREFAQSGYDDASTNQIVEDANIAKGALFHYFRNKKQMFLYLFDYFIDMFVKELSEKVDMQERDFFQRMRNISELKQQLIRKHPYIIQFFEKVYFEDSEDLKGEMDGRKQKLLDNNMGKFFGNIDMTRFKEGYDFNRILEIVTWSFEGLANKHAAGGDIDFDKIFRESEELIVFFQKCFYKEG